MRFALGFLSGVAAFWAALAVWQRVPALGPIDPGDEADGYRREHPAYGRPGEVATTSFYGFEPGYAIEAPPPLSLADYRSRRPRR